MLRTSPTELPTDLIEQRKILEADPQRAITVEKKNKHYPDFIVVKELLNLINYPTNIFDQTFSDTLHIREILSDPDLIILKNVEQLLDQAKKLIDDITSKVIADPIPYQSQLNKIYHYLGEEDQIQKADIILVCGWKHIDRAEKAIELYHKGISNLILFSGGHPIYDPRPSEASTYRTFALEKEIPGNNIVTEEQSVSLAGNIIGSLNLIEQHEILAKTIALVCSPFAQRRAWSHLQKFSNKGTKIVRINASPLPQMSQETWFQKEETFKQVINEFFKMLVSMMLNTA